MEYVKIPTQAWVEFVKGSGRITSWFSSSPARTSMRYSYKPQLYPAIRDEMIDSVWTGRKEHLKVDRNNRILGMRGHPQMQREFEGNQRALPGAYLPIWKRHLAAIVLVAWAICEFAIIGIFVWSIQLIECNVWFMVHWQSHEGFLTRSTHHGLVWVWQMSTGEANHFENPPVLPNHTCPINSTILKPLLLLVFSQDSEIVMF